MSTISPIRIWFEAKMLDSGLSREDLEGLLQVDPKTMTRLLNGKSTWSLHQIKAVADLFRIHWFYDFLMPLQVGDTPLPNDVMISQAAKALAEDGDYYLQAPQEAA